MNFQIPESQSPSSGRYGRFRRRVESTESGQCLLFTGPQVEQSRKRYFFTLRPHPLLVDQPDSASLLIGLVPPAIDQTDFDVHSIPIFHFTKIIRYQKKNLKSYNIGRFNSQVHLKKTRKALILLTRGPRVSENFGKNCKKSQKIYKKFTCIEIPQI